MGGGECVHLFCKVKCSQIPEFTGCLGLLDHTFRLTLKIQIHKRKMHLKPYSDFRSYFMIICQIHKNGI